MKILTAFCKYDYGIKDRGFSAEHLIWVPAFQEAGFETIPFYFEENGHPEDSDGLQQRLLVKVEQHRPDYVFFILMTTEIRLETLDKINRISKTVNWFCDDQWRFDDFSVKVGPHLSLCLTVDKYCSQKYRDHGIPQVRVVHWSPPFNLSEVPIETTGYEFDVSFVGSKNPTREWIVDALAARGMPVACFGQGWPGGKVSFERMREIFLRSKINLNLSNSTPQEVSFEEYLRGKSLEENERRLNETKGYFRRRRVEEERVSLMAKRFLYESPKNQEQVKARNFEIAGCGGFQVGKMAIGLEDFYQIGKEIAVYNTLEELCLLINYYLKNETERRAMARCSFERTKAYLLKDQLREIFGLTV